MAQKRTRSVQKSAKTIRGPLETTVDWALTLLLWFITVLVLDNLIAGRLYNIVSPEALGLSSESPFTMRHFALLFNATLAALLLPIFTASADRLRLIATSGIAMVIVPFAFFKDIGQEISGYTTFRAPLAIVAGSFVLIGLGKLYLLHQQKPLTVSGCMGYIRRHIYPVVIIGAGLAADQATRFGSPFNDPTINYTHLLAHNLAGTLLAVGVLWLCLSMSHVINRRSLYVVFSLLVILSSLHIFAVKATHHSDCTRSRYMLSMIYTVDQSNSFTQTNAAEQQRELIQRNCDPSYDLPPPEYPPSRDDDA